MTHPSLLNAAAMAGSSSTSTDEMMLASTTRTGATSGRSSAASPSMTVTLSLTPLRATFSSALPMAS